MKRQLTNFLKLWLNSPERKPLVLRGARQVGKTWLVRNFAEEHNLSLNELNFEKDPSLASLFTMNDPKIVLINLNAHFSKKIEPPNTLLFLDEIQAAPEILSKLRWFAEELPELPIIAAGSLLEFVLSDNPHSTPVGRINFAHLEPLSFEEFLHAKGEDGLYSYLYSYDLQEKIPKAIHEKLLSTFKEYIIIGGMPAVVDSWISYASLDNIGQLQNDLLATYRDDFSKYKGRIPHERFHEVLSAIPAMLGQKFVFSQVNKEIQAGSIKQVLSLLEKARVAHRVQSTAANGLPLLAEVKKNFFKEIFLDTGLACQLLGLNLKQIKAIDEIALINSGNIAEQVTGQLLRTIGEPYIEPSLFYWHREAKGSNAEIDYIIQNQQDLIPIEVKAGSTGSLKSLHVFMGVKKLQIAIRINSDLPSSVIVNVKDSLGHPVKYKLISLPFYLIGQIPRILQSSKDEALLDA